MRILSLTFALLLFGLALHAQSDTALLRKAWVGPELAYLNFDQKGYSMDFYGQWPQDGAYTLLGDTLRLHKIRYYGEKKTLYGDGDFLIKRLTTDSLILVPINWMANKKLRGQPILYYKDQALTAKKDLRFDSLVLKSSHSYSSTPTMEIQINQKKQVKFSGLIYVIKDGSYTDILPDSTYQQLLYLLSISELDHLKSWGQEIHDDKPLSLQIWYNNKMMLIECRRFPMVADKLEQLLFKISATTKLERSSFRSL
ncbi:DUF6438 domain-containing protein [Chitinophaga flava]|uniref:DUF6438 domain-containing protein n=1 Tax=Chitinophaga flava TaxID=2259036 RepID=A0A365Y404_9BACT|nr:hypothetical protein [Chitinophaga flava]RBL93313.1 hypothetical protein DF182_12350 [Chitinophaga flava]